MKKLRTPQEVVEALGGPEGLSELTGMSKRSIYEHVRPGGRQCFPSYTYLKMTSALQRRGMTASPELWQMVA